VKFSFWPGTGLPFDGFLDAARHAEASGWDGVYVADHFMPNGGAGPMLEAATTVTAVAALVPRVRVGTLVLGNTYRHPAVVANMAATIDRISGGRLVLGVGAGWQRNEHEQYGIDLPPVRERLDRFEEAVQVLRGLLTRERFSFAGEHYTLTDATCEPKPVQSPMPILIGGSGEKRMLKIVARHADEWNTWGTPETFEHKTAVLARHCADVGRDPSTIARSAQAVMYLGTDAPEDSRFPTIAGGPERLVEALRRYEAAGLDEFIVPGFHLGAGDETHRFLETFQEKVVQRLAA
jgi:F420-dependent oxidoreductase-like protein